MADDNSTEARVLSDILDRIDKLTQHIIDIKGDMYRRTEWNQDAARIYDSISSVQSQLLTAVKEAVLAFDKRADRIERESLSIATFEAYKDAHSKNCTLDQTRLISLEETLASLKRKIVHPAVLAGFGTALGAAATWLVERVLSVLFPTK